ncbi:MAG: CDP-alcohol phosphatidyltransferase family protein [Frankiaceae bacterium]
MSRQQRVPAPTIRRIREIGQPESVLGRVNAEHWAGRLYMRRLSPYATRALLRTSITANGVTWLMIAAGLLAAVALSLPGLAGAVAAVVLIQAQLLFDCADGEVARWRATQSPAGVYLDRIGHYTTEAALAVALGLRADGGWGSINGWTTLGLLGAVLVLLVKSETDLVDAARARAGVAVLADIGVPPRVSRLGTARQLLRFLPFFRMYLAVECSLLALVAAVADAATGTVAGTRTLLLIFVPAVAGTAVGYLASVLASHRLR